MRVPKYRQNPDGRAFVEYRTRRYYLGLYGSPESLAAYKDFIRKVFAAPADEIPPSRMTIALAVERYLEYAETYYAQDGRPTQEFLNVRVAVGDLLTLFGALPASNFGPKSILALQQHLITEGYARTSINARVGRVKRCLRWCVSRELIPASVIDGIWTVDGLRRGRTAAVETEPVGPVAWEHVEATLPHLSPIVATMVQVQYHCGMRPGEVCAMRACDIDMSGRIWIYRPEQHKNRWRGKPLIKAVPPVAQALLRPYLTHDLTAPLFNPRESVAWWAAQKPRKTKIYPCERRQRDAIRQKRARRRGGRPVPTVFRADSYARAVRDGIARANEAGKKVPSWSPNQLRHSIGTELSQSLGQQAAQRWLGHARLETTAIYAEIQERELVEIAEKLAAAKPRHAAR